MSNVKPAHEQPIAIVKECYNAKTVLPEFQRSFVWANSDIQDLLVSILNDYFIGTFLFIRRGKEFEFKLRYIEGLQELRESLPKVVDESHSEKAVLDGQQRITALFYVLYNPPGFLQRVHHTHIDIL